MRPQIAQSKIELPGSFLAAALHEYNQYTNNGHESEQQPHPLPNGARMFCYPALRGNIVSLCELGGSGCNEAASPALDATRGNPELLADSFNGFALEQTQHGVNLFMARKTRMPVIVPRYSRIQSLLVRLHGKSRWSRLYKKRMDLEIKAVDLLRMPHP